VILINLGSVDKKILVNDKIAQIIFENYNEVKFEETSNLPITDRGAGGFGHTDLKTPIRSTIEEQYSKVGGIPVKQKYSDEIKNRETK
jgi:hypothetical protein